MGASLGIRIRSKKMIKTHHLSCYLLIFSGILSVNAVGAELKGHLKGQYQYAPVSDQSLASALDESDLNEALIDFRLMGEYGRGNWQLQAHYQLKALVGNGVSYRNQLYSRFPALAPPNNQWFDLSNTLASSQNSQWVHGLDRLILRYTSEQLVIKLGRQALSWGNGLVFRPMDLFNPFSPYEVDTSYKPGTDMLYGQWLMPSGSDISLIGVPRRGADRGALDSQQSSGAIKWHYFGARVQGDLMLARDYGDAVLGLGLNGPLADAVWRMDLVPVYLRGGGSRSSLVINIEQAWQWSGRNISGFAEYYRNGFGLGAKNYTLQDLPPELSERLARGQLFNTGRDYLATGARIQTSELLQMMPSLMFNLNDQSLLLFVQGLYSVSQNINLDFGLLAGMGGRGSEFGGLQTSPGSGIYVRLVNRLYARLSWYF